MSRTTWLWLVVWGCATKASDPETSPSSTIEDTADPCIDAPIVTWDNWGQGFLVENCQSCHRSTAPDRHGAPADVTFDDESSALALADRILDRCTSDPPTMPPRGGITTDDQALLVAWLTCGETP